MKILCDRNTNESPSPSMENFLPQKAAKDLEEVDCLILMNKKPTKTTSFLLLSSPYKFDELEDKIQERRQEILFASAMLLDHDLAHGLLQAAVDSSALFAKCLLSTCSVPGAIQGNLVTKMNKTWVAGGVLWRAETEME